MGWEALSRALQKMSGSSNMPATSEKPPEPSQSTTKTQDLLAFRTIITMLSCIQSSNTRLATKAGPTRTEKDRAELRVLDALSTVLIRRHEITAVVARPHDGINFQVFASVAYPSNAEPLLQPDDKGLWSRICNFTVTTNPRVSKMHTRTDSLINLSSIPVIGDHQDQVPGELVTAAKENSTDVLNIFLKTHW
jgi:hypothetical protein